MGSLPADSEQFMLIEHLAGELDKLAENIETGQAPFDQQQTLTLDFYKDRIETLETEVKEIRKDMMQMVHDMNGMKSPSQHSGH
jgi:predicted  nucleic acid-binding Zn-ribbon protein